MGGPQWFWFLRNESVMYRAIGERQMREEEEEGEEFWWCWWGENVVGPSGGD